MKVMTDVMTPSELRLFRHAVMLEQAVVRRPCNLPEPEFPEKRELLDRMESEELTLTE